MSSPFFGLHSFGSEWELLTLFNSSLVPLWFSLLASFSFPETHSLTFIMCESGMSLKKMSIHFWEMTDSIICVSKQISYYFEFNVWLKSVNAYACIYITWHTFRIWCTSFKNTAIKQPVNNKQTNKKNNLKKLNTAEWKWTFCNPNV